MESLAYLHLALAYESPTDAEVPFWGLKFEPFHWQKRYNIRTYLLLLMVALSVFGLVNEALAQQAAPGERGFEVEAIQERLQDRGYFYGSIDGNYGPITTEAVRRFQQNQNLQVDGIVGSETEAALFNNFSSRTSSRTESRRSNTSNLNRRIQERLRDEGFYFGSIDGIIGSQTRQAISAFQRYRGLSVTGAANRETLQALGIRGGREENGTPYVVAVPGDDETLREVRRVLRRNGVRDNTASLAPSRLGTYVNAGAFSSREFAESRSFLLRGYGFKDARVIYFP